MLYRVATALALATGAAGIRVGGFMEEGAMASSMEEVAKPIADASGKGDHKDLAMCNMCKQLQTLHETLRGQMDMEFQPHDCSMWCHKDANDNHGAVVHAKAVHKAVKNAADDATKVGNGKPASGTSTNAAKEAQLAKRKSEESPEVGGSLPSDDFSELP